MYGLVTVLHSNDGQQSEIPIGRDGKSWTREMTGAADQQAREVDLEVGSALREELFMQGGDLIARNIQRAREHGIPSYGALREACGLGSLNNKRPAEIEEKTWLRLIAVYKSADNIDPFTGGLAETAPADGVVGPLFACIIGRQFRSLRDGDRYFFTHQPDTKLKTRGLGPVARSSVLRRSLAAVMCDNIGSLTIQKDVFKLAKYQGLQSCKDSRLDFEAISEEIVSSQLTTQDTVIVTSPNYPNNYPSNADTSTPITVSDGTISISFDFFSVEGHPSCAYDWVKVNYIMIRSHYFQFTQITDGDGTVLMDQTCGTTKPDDVESKTNK